MESSLQDIQALITTELKALNKYIYKILKRSDLLLGQLTKYLLQHPGKQLRPQLVFLVAGASGGITEKTRRGAALVTLLHNASLVHDDVVDEATHRRGMSSINAIWKNKAAVLLGDYILSSGLRIIVEHQDYDFLETISNTTQAMSEGELLQIEKAHQLAITEAEYLQIIQQKTASLMAACCAIGALSANASGRQADIMYQVGDQLGIAFQIQDDLLDYNSAGKLGKATGMDIKEKKITLPLLYALQQATEHDRQNILHMIKNHGQKPEKVQEIMAFVRSVGGITYAQEMMYGYRRKALELLAVYVQPSPYKKMLTNLIYQVID
ncbi:MAG: polyprenyl synthetase family protein [Bacteroidota bacterium]